MAHLALYRTYRPQDFHAVIGQQHIVQTIKNQIKKDLLAHAYVLTGPRGTGKTSIARIVAKAINCTDPKDANPCGTCESCAAVTNGNHPDVFELDGASNNGVDEIRDIRDRVKYAPSLSAYKVYIIDEVHMLSTGAFNALLKTLEEPPPHVLFLLATTEIHKVPETILSRVQRFDLKQIATPDMTAFLIRILTELNVPFEEGAPELIATLAAGGMRDALSMLDQAIAYQTDTLKLADVHDLNGSVSTTSLVQITLDLHTERFAEALEALRELLAQGKLPARILDGLMMLLRDVLKSQKLKTADPTGLAEQISSQQVLLYLKKLNELAYDLKRATDSALMLEIGLLELGLKEEPANTEASPSAHADVKPPTDGLAELLKQMQHQIETLQKELAALKADQKPAAPMPTAVDLNVAPPAAVPLQPESGLPIYVQGELVQEAGDRPASYAPDPTEPVEPDEEAQAIAAPQEPLSIEQLLLTATKPDKHTLQSLVAAANPFSDLAVKEWVMLLKDAEIVAASPIGCILVYDYETTVQKLLTDDAQTHIHQLLAEMLEKPYGFLALPKEFWQKQRESYVLATKNGEAPKLESYPQHAMKSASALPPEQPAEAPFYQEVVELFGDMVEVEA